MKEVFISYASKQIDTARSLCAMIEQNGISAFVAERDIPAGAEYASEIVKAIDHAKVVVLVLSQAANDSPHVLREVERAVGHNVPIIVYAYEEVQLSDSMAYFLMTNQWLRNSDNRDELLLNGLRSITGNTTGAKPIITEPEPEKTSTKKKGKMGVLIGIGAVLLAGIVVAGILLSQKLGKEKTPETPSETVPIVQNTPTSDADTTAEATEDTSANASTEAPATEYKLGASIELGTYLEDPITWRLIHVNEDGTGVFIAADILTIKAFDSAECGTHNNLDGVDYWGYENTWVTDQELLVQIRGNNEWGKSNIRTWLNSDAEKVSYPDQAPTKQASVLHQNAYSEEPGFLHGFTEEEKALLVSTTRRTKGNKLSETDAEGMVTSEEAVFLLSVEEMKWFEDAGISAYGKPTEKALDQDETSVRGILEDYRTDTYDWWLRDPGLDFRIGKEFPDNPEFEGGFESANIGTVASADYRDVLVFTDRFIGACVSYGIRPAITIDLSKLPQ